MRRTRTAWVVLGVVLGATAPAGAGVIKAGSFTKSGSTGAQTITHDLGVTPRALILWTNGKTGTTASIGYTFGFGVSDGTTSRSVAASSEDTAPGSRSNASRRIADKALTMVRWGEHLIAEADLRAWTETTLTLDWTTNDGNAGVVHYLLVGGNGVSAKVVGWQLNPTAGVQAVAGVGFQPDVVIHAHAGADFTAAPPATRATSAFGLGVMDADGASWANTQLAADDTQRSDTQRYQRTDRALLAIDTTPAVAREATFSGMLPNGFAVQLPGAGAVTQVVSLALRGVRARAGSISKVVTAAPVDQNVVGLGFRPGAVLLSSVQDTSEGAPAVHARFGLGGGDGARAGGVAWQDTNDLNKSDVDGIDLVDKAFVKIDNAAGTVDAAADLSSLDASGFTLRWSTNDALTTQLVYLALAPRQRVWIVD